MRWTVMVPCVWNVVSFAEKSRWFDGFGLLELRKSRDRRIYVCLQAANNGRETTNVKGRLCCNEQRRTIKRYIGNKASLMDLDGSLCLRNNGIELLVSALWGEATDESHA